MGCPASIDEGEKMRYLVLFLLGFLTYGDERNRLEVLILVILAYIVGIVLN